MTDLQRERLHPHREPLHPHRSGITATIELGTNAEVYFEASKPDSCPEIEIDTGAISLVFVPHSLAEGGDITECDVTLWRNFAGAAIAMADDIAQQWAQRIARPPSTPDDGEEVNRMTEVQQNVEDGQLPADAGDVADEGTEDVDADSEASDE